MANKAKDEKAQGRTDFEINTVKCYITAQIECYMGKFMHIFKAKVSTDYSRRMFAISFIIKVCNALRKGV